VFHTCVIITLPTFAARLPLLEHALAKIRLFPGRGKPGKPSPGAITQMAAVKNGLTEDETKEQPWQKICGKFADERK
jgi:hypothetical protein